MRPHYKSSAYVRDDAQASVNAWANLLISTGGALNPDKCYWYMIDYICVDGEWNYAPQVDWTITIPTPDGSAHPISQLQMNTSQKMLGVWSNPAGKDARHLTHLKDKYQKWLDRSINGHLPARMNWDSYLLKLYPGLRYGLATLATPTAQINHLFSRMEYRTLPLLGVNRSIKKEWRNIPRAFGGVGLLDVTIEQMIGWANMLLQHYNAPSTLGMKCKATLEALQMELGCTGNPLMECFRTRGILATPSWITSVWECCWQYKFQIHLAYDDLRIPRENDTTIVALFLQQGVKGMELRRLNRCRLALQAIFLSDIVTANGKHLEHGVLGARKCRTSKFQFAREEPSGSDWDLWDAFWLDWIGRNNKIPAPLGKWLHESHQNWRWFLDETNILWERVEDGWMKYCFNQDGRSTRNNRNYTPTGLWQHPDLTQAVPVSIKQSGISAQILDTGPAQHTPTTSKPSFWEYVEQQGGTWMWEFIEGKHEDMSWIANALQLRSAIMVMDGSYNRPKAPRISGAGWVLVCTSSMRMIRGSFYEESPNASSYRGELLGLTTIHHLVAYCMEYYRCTTATGSMHCDNKGALRQASYKRRRVRTNTKHSDLIRNLRYLKGRYNFDVEYLHVKAHQDNIFSYDELTLVQQLNVLCDLLAKQAVESSFGDPSSRQPLSQLLPCEQSAIIVDGVKLTTDVASEVRFALGRTAAKKFFTKPVRIRRESNVGGLGWEPAKFECIDLRILHRVLASKPQMYGVWLSKQTTGTCATRRVTARIQGTADDKCPNCLHGPERSTHLNRCLDPGRTSLFETDVENLYLWLCKTTDAELRYWIKHFLLLRGEHSMSSLGDMSPAIAEVAAGFDTIGWTDVLHGRLPCALHRYQQTYCISVNSRMTGTDWMKAFVEKLLEISHAQWMYRNFSLHNKTTGYLRQTHQAEVLAEIATLSNSCPEDIPESSQFLLEVEMTRLDGASLAQQEYWIAAMKTALSAGRRTATHNRRRNGTHQTSRGPEGFTARQRRDLHRFRHRIHQLLQQMREDLDLTYGTWRTKRPRQSDNARLNGSNKRLRKPD